MNNGTRNIIAIVIIAGVIVFIATRNRKAKKMTSNTGKPAVSDANNSGTLTNAQNSLDAIKMAIMDNADVQDLTDLKNDIFDKYGLTVGIDDNNNATVKNTAGDTVLKQSID